MRSLPSWLVVGLSLAAAEARAQGSPGGLERAEQLVADARYPEALKVVDAAAKVEGNDRATVLRILELQGILCATLNQEARASRAFRTLLILDPQHKLPGDNPPRVMTPFYEAKGWVTENGALAFEPLEQQVLDGHLAHVGLKVTKNPLGVVRKVRFHLRVAGEWAVQESDLEKDRAMVKMDLPADAWWAELVGEHAAVVSAIGTEAEPAQVAPATAAVAAAPAKAAPAKAAPARAAAPLPPEKTEAQASRSEATELREDHPAPGSSLRPVSYAVAVAGAAGLGTGIFFGARSASERSQINNAQKDAQGRITNLTQKQAYQLDSQTKSDALIANTLMVSGAALLAGGAALWFFSGSAAVTPAPGGVAVSGSF